MARCIAGVFFGCAVGAHAARSSRDREPNAPQGKTIRDVPVMNYHLAEADTDIKGSWMVATKRWLQSKDLAQLCESSGACKKIGHPSEGGVPFFEVEATEQELDKLLHQWQGKVEFVEPDQNVELLQEVEEENNDVDAQSSAFWHLNRIGAVDRASTGAGVHIYMMDTGIRHSHSDFGGRAAPAIDMSSDQLVECTQGWLGGYGPTCAADRQGHGTHVAATAAGGMFGVAPGARVYGVKVIGDDSRGEWSWAASALDWVGFKGKRPAVAAFAWDGDNNSIMRTAVDAAVRAGVIVVVAAGNKNSDACNFSPALASNAITVGSTTSRDEKSVFSNSGKCVDMWAPGSAIVSAGVASDIATRTLFGASACPQVAGGAALELQANPSASRNEIFIALLENSEKEALSGLSSEDENNLLWVSAAPAPSHPPVSCRRRLLCLR